MTSCYMEQHSDHVRVVIVEGVCSPCDLTITAAHCCEEHREVPLPSQVCQTCFARRTKEPACPQCLGPATYWKLPVAYWRPVPDWKQPE